MVQGDVDGDSVVSPGNGATSDEGFEEERVDETSPSKEDETAPIWIEAKEEAVIEVVEEVPKPSLEEPVVLPEEANNGFGWGSFGGATKSRKVRRI